MVAHSSFSFFEAFEAARDRERLRLTRQADLEVLRNLQRLEDQALAHRHFTVLDSVLRLKRRILNLDGRRAM